MDTPMSMLPPSPFLNSTVSPRAVESAVASSDLQPRATAEQIQFADSSGETRAARSEQEDCGDDRTLPGVAVLNPIPASTGGPQETPASAPTKNPDAGVLDATDCIGEIFFYARRLSAEVRWFVPDYPDIYQAMLDPNAPRALETDPVWADDPPLFLQRQA